MAPDLGHCRGRAAVQKGAAIEHALLDFHAVNQKKRQAFHPVGSMQAA